MAIKKNPSNHTYTHACTHTPTLGRTSGCPCDGTIRIRGDDDVVARAGCIECSQTCGFMTEYFIHKNTRTVLLQEGKLHIPKFAGTCGDLVGRLYGQGTAAIVAHTVNRVREGVSSSGGVP